MASGKAAPTPPPRLDGRRFSRVGLRGGRGASVKPTDRARAGLHRGLPGPRPPSSRQAGPSVPACTGRPPNRLADWTSKPRPRPRLARRATAQATLPCPRTRRGRQGANTRRLNHDGASGPRGGMAGRNGGHPARHRHDRHHRAGMFTTAGLEHRPFDDEHQSARQSGALRHQGRRAGGDRASVMDLARRQSRQPGCVAPEAAQSRRK